MAMMAPGMCASHMPWLHAAASFLAMWTAMMLVMMLPSLTPALWRYRRARSARRAARPHRDTLLFGVGYTAVWTAVGVIVLLGDVAVGALRPLGVAHMLPVAVAVIVCGAGALQLTRWKVRQLAHCRGALVADGARSRSSAGAWNDGIRFGSHCVMSCAGPTAVLLVIGIMDVRAMAVVTAAITAERMVPAGAAIARATGAIGLGAGIVLLATAIGAA